MNTESPQIYESSRPQAKPPAIGHDPHGADPQIAPKNGRNGFDSVPRTETGITDAAERVPASTFCGSMQQPSAVAQTHVTNRSSALIHPVPSRQVGTPAEAGAITNSKPFRPQRILIAAAHADDEILAPGSVVAEALQAGLDVYVAVLAADDPVRCRESAGAAKALGLPPSHFLPCHFQDGNLTAEEVPIRKVLTRLSEQVAPDIVITHRDADNHPDHGAVCRAVRSVFARKGVSILQFRIPQPVATAWHPRVFVRVGPTAAASKLKLFGCFPSQNWKDYFDRRMHTGIMAEAGHAAGSRFAEPFESCQMRLQCCQQCGSLALARATEPALSGLGITPCVRVLLEFCPHGCGTLALAGATHATIEPAATQSAEVEGNPS